MSLIRRNSKKTPPLASDLIRLRDDAALLCLSESTIRQRKAGTEGLTLIRQGNGQRNRVFLLRSEVEAYLNNLITDAREQSERPLKLVYGTYEKRR